MKTCHSDYGRIQSVILKSASSAFQSDAKIAEEWKALNYLSPVDLAKAREEYGVFQTYFQEMGTEVLLLPASETSMDSIYCRDAALATDFGLILCNMGKPARSPEPLAIEAFCNQIV